MKRYFRLFLIFLLISGTLLFAGAIFTVWFSLQELPSIDALKNYQPPQSTVVLDRSGKIVGRFYDERRTVIATSRLPKHVKMAFIAAEDGDFFEHRGIDYWGLLRAMVLEVRYKTIGGRRVGGSTITQQTARTMLLTSTQTYVRKIKEIVLAQRIEDALSKEEILHLYLNQIYFGNGAYGIEEAAQTYFSKKAVNLTLLEAAALASIPKSPNRINPLGDRDRLMERVNYVLDQMVKNNFITMSEAQAAKAEPFFNSQEIGSKEFAPYFLRAIKTEILPKLSDEVIRRGGLKIYSTLDITLQKYAEQAMTSGLREIDKRNGYRGPLFRPTKEQNSRLDQQLAGFKERAFKKPYHQKIWDLSGLGNNTENEKIETVIEAIPLVDFAEGAKVAARVISVDDAANFAVLDLGSSKVNMPMSKMAWARAYAQAGASKPLPKKVSQVLKPGDIVLVSVIKDEKDLTVKLEQEPLINGGLVALDVETGGVLAMVGGYSFERSPFNRITQARRQPGSGIKPLIYALAIDKELVTANSIITDAPKAFFNPGTNDFWRPRNHTRKFLGDITLRHCLRSSINICTITLLEKIGLDAFLGFAREVELHTAKSPYPRNLTIALGSAENYPINVANAMRVLANGGQYSPFYLIEGIKPFGGAVEKMPGLEKKSVMRPEAAFIVSNILQDVVNESKRETSLPDVKCQLAGKTGTTNDARSVWFFGYSKKILALVYVGYDDNRSTGSNEWGVTAAFPIWARFMNMIPEHREEMNFSVPEHIMWRWVDRDGGAKDPPAEDELLANKMMEVFIEGTAPSLETAQPGPSPSMEDVGFAP